MKTPEKQASVKCTAKNRAGEPCKKWAIMGKTKCRNHGGASTGAPKGSQNRKTHGIYSRFYSDEEQSIISENDLSTANLDEEITLFRIQIYRAIKQQFEFDDKLTITEVIHNYGEMVNNGGAIERIRKETLVDHTNKIDKLMGRLQSLIKLRADLNQSDREELKFDQPYIIGDEQAPDEPIV